MPALSKDDADKLMLQPSLMTDKQLNAAVITEVMGLEVHPVTGHPIVDGKMCAWFGPVTDYAAAFDVVERMREDGWVFMLHQWNDSKTVRATFHRLGSGKPYRTGDAPVGQDARAICEAALKAVRSET